MKIAIFGTGGVGGYFGGRLAQAGQDVVFIARGKHLAAIQESGLRVDSIGGNFILNPAQATDSTETVGAVDLVILATKGWQLESSLNQIKHLVGESTIILPLLNGIEHMDLLLNTFGKKHVMGGVFRISSFIAGPGHIEHVNYSPSITFGELDGSRSERVEELFNLFNSLGGIKVETPDDINAAMWEKFVYITGVSGVGAYSRRFIGEIRSDPDLRKMLSDTMEETSAVGRARGVALSEKLVDEILSRVDKSDPEMIPSMQKDIMEGRPSELNEQTGAVIRMGKAAGVKTPTHEKIYERLLPLEQKAGKV